MLRNFLRTAVAPCLALGLCCLGLRGADIATVHMATPVLGYYFDDAAKTIRRISGIPGAAAGDSTVEIGVGLRSAFVNSSDRLAIGITKEETAAVIHWIEGSSTGTLVRLETGLGTLTDASLTGTAAILTDGITVEIWSQLADVPSRTGQYRFEEGIAAVAINKDGGAAVSTRRGQIVFLTGDSPAMIATSGDWTALAFSGDSLLATDAAAGDLVRFADVATNPARVVVEKFSGVPVSLAASRDGASAVIAFTDDLALVNLAGGITPVVCGCQTHSLHLLEGNLVVHLAGAERTLLLDGDGTEPRIIQLPGAPMPIMGVIAQ